jgi:hypothetical protein
LNVALDAWAVGFLSMDAEDAAPDQGLPDADKIRKTRQEQLGNSTVEAAILEHAATALATFRPLTEDEVRPVLAENG